MIRSSKFHFVILVLISLGLLLFVNLTRFTLEADGIREYALYLQIVETGTWQVEDDNILNTCIFSTYLPALFQRATGLDPLMVYRFFPLVFFIFLPPMVYLIARNLISNGMAFSSAVLFMGHFHYLYSFGAIRLSIAILFYSVIVYVALFTTWRLLWRFPVVALCSVAVVFSHYGSTYYVLVILLCACLGWIAYKWWGAFRYGDFYCLATALIIIFLTTQLWHTGLLLTENLKVSGYARKVVVKAVDETVGEVKEVVVSEKIEAKAEEKPKPSPSPAPPPTPIIPAKRDPVVVEAFQPPWLEYTVGQKVTFTAHWIWVVLLTIGVISLVRYSRRPLFNTLLLASYAAVVITTVVPALSVSYGIIRTIYSSSILFNACTLEGIGVISQRIRLNPYALVVPFILVYALCNLDIVR